MPPTLKILKTTIRVPGLAKPLRILHVTDIHLCECDERDPLQREYLATTDKKQGGQALANFDRLLAALPKLKPDFIAFTGDLMVSPTEANFETLLQRLDRHAIPYGLTLGNHDWDLPIRGSQTRDRLQRKQITRRFFYETGHEPAFQHFVLDGIQLVFVDNSDYQLRSPQSRQVKVALRRGPPALLFYHVPVSRPKLRAATVAKWGDPILCGDSDWPAPRRRVWHAPLQDTAITLQFCEAVKTEPKLLGAFCGHVHLNHAEALVSGAKQYVTPPLYEGGARMIHLEPGSSQ